MNNRIAKELIEMARHDLEVREELLKEGKLSPGYNPDMERVHLENAKRLNEIINAIGYPTKSIVGEEASQAAWLIVQHAISLPVFMKRCYTLISEAGDEVSPQNFAYLHDRICYFEGRPQKFGTQFDSNGMFPVENKTEMIRLRKELQLDAHDEKSIVEFIPSVHKTGLHQNDEEFNHWRKQVGWL